jgi:hypothetical protein
VVAWVDEKPQVQVLESAQCYLRLPNGRMVTGVAREFARGGTTVFVALAAKAPDRETMSPRQLEHPRAQARPVARAPQEPASALHTRGRELAQSSRGLVPHLEPRGLARRHLHLAPPGARRLHRGPQPQGRLLRVALDGGAKVESKHRALTCAGKY